MKNKRILIGTIILFLISIFLETIVFNINSFRLMGNEYTYKKITVQEDMLHGLEKIGDNTYRVTSSWPEISLENLNMLTGTIRIPVKKTNWKDDIANRKLQVTVKYTDATSQYARSVPNKTIKATEKKSEYFTLHLSGETKGLILKIEVMKDTIIQIDDIEINSPVPYQFNIVRFFITFFSVLLLFLLFNLKFFEEPYNKKNSSHDTTLLAIFLTFVLILSFFMSTSTGGESGIYSNLDEIGKIIYEKYYPEAILSGSLSLKQEPSQELLEMENPYDDTVRTIEKVPQFFDYTYYQGKYYVYFSILPQLLLFVPFHMITGGYLNIAWAVFIFAILGAMYTVLLVKKIFEKYFKETKFRMMALAVIVALFSSLLLYHMGRPRVYEVVATCGYWLIMQGMYFLFKAFENKEKIKYGRLVISCISLALAVNARPNLILISLLVLPIFIQKLIELIKERKGKTEVEKKKVGKELIKYITAIAVPYLIIGIAIMALNYARFDSITEFGAAYQLTSNDMQALGYRPSTIPMGIWHYLFNPAQIDLEFPFIHPVPHNPLYLGFYGSGYAGIGTLLACPLCLLLLFLPWMRKHIKEKDIQLWKGIRNSIIIAVLMVVAITLLAASYQRYALDYAWMLVIPGIIVTMLLYDLIKEHKLLAKLFELTVTAVAVFCILLNLSLAITSEWNLTEKLSTQMYDDIESSMKFWE